MSEHFTESVVEQAALAWLESMGYLILSGLEITPGEAMAEREDCGQVVLEERVRQAPQRLNPMVSSDALKDVLRKLPRPMRTPTSGCSSTNFNRISSRLRRCLGSGLDLRALAAGIWLILAVWSAKFGV